MDHSSQIAVVGRIESRRVTDGATKLDWFERTSMIRGNEFSDEIRALRLQPRMEKETSSIEGATGIHKTNKGGVQSHVRA